MSTLRQTLAGINDKPDRILAGQDDAPKAADIHKPITDAIGGVKTSVDAVVSAIGTDADPTNG